MAFHVISVFRDAMALKWFCHNFRWYKSNGLYGFNQQTLVLSRKIVSKVINVEPSLMWNIGFRWGVGIGWLIPLKAYPWNCFLLNLPPLPITFSALVNGAVDRLEPIFFSAGEVHLSRRPVFFYFLRNHVKYACTNRISHVHSFCLRKERCKLQLAICNPNWTINSHLFFSHILLYFFQLNFTLW